MIKRTILSSCIALVVLLSGCGDSTDEVSCRIDVQIAIDKGNYEEAINALEGTCKNAFTFSDLNYNLATAYMGKAGYGVSDVLNLILDSSNSSGGTFSTFTSSTNSANSADSAVNLNKAKGYYLNAAREDVNATIATLCNAADLNSSIDTRFSSSCFYLGFNQILQTTNTISLLTQDIDTLVSSIDAGNNQTPLDMQASLDALSWATDTNNTLPNGSIITSGDINISGNSYAHLEVINSGKTFFRLVKSSVRDVNNSTVLTSDYCDLNGSKTNCSDIEDNVTKDGSIDLTKSTGCYACPIDFGNGETQDITTILVDALNGGTEAIANVSNDPDIEKSINEFKTDITGGADRNITVQDILDYLNK